MEIFAIILFIISILILVYCYKISKKTHTINTEIDKENQLLAREYEDLKERINIANQTKARAEEALKEKEIQLDWLTKNFDKNLEYQKSLSNSAFETYCDLLLKN